MPLSNIEFDRKRLLIAGRCAETIFRQRSLLGKAALTAGWRVSVTGDDSGPDYSALLASNGFAFDPVKVNQSSKNPLSILTLVLAYRGAIRDVRPSIFHAFNIKPTVAGLIAARTCGVPVIIATVAGLGHAVLSPNPFVRWASIILFRIAFTAAHRVYFYNSDDMNYFVEKKIVAPKKAMLINGSGVDTTRFSHQPPPASARFTALFIGRLLNEKGINELFSAARLLKASGSLADIHIVGDIDSNNPSSITHHDIAREVAAGNVTWHGSTNDVVPFIQAAHAIVLPSYREGIPLVLIEGAAVGRALIATDVAGCHDVVRNGVTGILVPLGDVHALASAIDALANDRERTDAMGNAARQDVLARFDAQVVNAAVLADYDQLLAKAPM